MTADQHATDRADAAGSSPPVDLQADLVLEGGGVKGIALAGAVAELARAGYRFPRVAGTSAGAMAGSVLAALQARGEPLERITDIASSVDYAKFRDRGLVGRLLGPLGFIDDGFSLVFRDGIFRGDYVHDWLASTLGDLGVETFGDLRVDDPAGDGDVHHAYSLVVTASDLSRQRFVQLPWDYAEYGLDPDEQPVADAVRASLSMPFFYQPVSLKGPRGTATLVDGGLLSNYPIDIFDRRDTFPPRWPTIGVRLSARRSDTGPIDAVDGLVPLALSLVETSLSAWQAERSSSRCNLARSMFVDTSAVSSTDFGVTDEQRDRLLAEGEDAARRFLKTWSFEHWIDVCRGAPTGRGG